MSVQKHAKERRLFKLNSIVIIFLLISDCYAHVYIIQLGPIVAFLFSFAMS